jgi:RNA-directed DNA polymerase
MLTQNQQLLDKILAPENLNKAWIRVRKNKGAAGIDGQSIKDFIQHFREHGKGIIEEIRAGRYHPYPVKRVYIEKPDGTLRGLGIPTVLDRVIQQAIVQVLTPIVDPKFSDYSFGFRPNCSQHKAVLQVQEFEKQGRKIAVDVDLSKFFDRVNHDFLMTLLRKITRDKNLLKLIGRLLRAGAVEDGIWQATLEGVPQGGPLSPLLSNIVLDLLDKELEKRNHAFVRYADDFIILVFSQSAGERVLKSVTRFVERKLKLKVNDQKSQVAPIYKCKFLGFTFRDGKFKWHNSVMGKFKFHVRQITGRSNGVSMEARIAELTIYLRGWINYFGVGQGFEKCTILDRWIRRRLRMCYWKSWRRMSTKVSNLLKLGVPRDLAIRCGSSNKSHWHSSKTEGIHRALPNDFFKRKGLLSLKDRWLEIHSS